MYKYTGVLGSDLAQHIRLFIYKCLKFKLCGTGRQLENLLKDTF